MSLWPLHKVKNINTSVFCMFKFKTTRLHFQNVYYFITFWLTLICDRETRQKNKTTQSLQANAKPWSNFRSTIKLCTVLTENHLSTKLTIHCGTSRKMNLLWGPLVCFWTLTQWNIQWRLCRLATDTRTLRFRFFLSQQVNNQTETRINEPTETTLMAVSNK